MTPNPYAYLDQYQEEPEIAPVTIGGYNTLKKTYSYNPVPVSYTHLLFEHNVVGLFGENGVEGMNLVKRWEEPDEERYSLPIDGFFLAIGHKPNSDIFKPLSLIHI